MVHSSYGNAKLKNIFLSSIILLCEVGIEEFEKTVIPKRVQQIKEDIKEDEPGA